MSDTRNPDVPDQDILPVLRQLREKITSLERARREPIAIVGMGCRLPGSVSSAESLWQFLASGGTGIGEIPGSRWDLAEFYHPDPEAAGRMNVRHAALIEGAREFDPYFFGISPREAALMDPQQRIFLEVAWEALEDAGQTEKDLRGTATGVFVGANSTDYLQLQLADTAAIGTYTISGGTNCMIANRLSYQLDLRGPSLVLDTACSSSLVAAHLAVQSLRAGECDAAIVGGVNLILSPVSMIAHAKGLPLAQDGRCKTFDARADGYARGEGVVAVVLKRLGEAIASGDRIWAVIRGSAVNQDGLTNGLTAPNGRAQQEVIERALANARLSPSAVTLIEAHGTGTSLGDPIEVESLAAVYGRPSGDGDCCAIGAVKPNIGHLEAAAGLTGLIKAALCISHGTIVPNLHLESLNPLITLDDSRLFVPTSRQPWDQPGERRHAAVSSFGAGGTNAHVILGPAPDQALTALPGPTGDDREHRCLVAVSARTADALCPMVGAYRDYLGSAGEDSRSLRDIAYSAALRRTQHEYRAVVVASSAAHAARDLTEWLDKKEPGTVFAGRASDATGKKIVFVFPGQGAQRIGMGRQLMQECAVFRETVAECDRLMVKWLGHSVIDEIHRAGSDAGACQIALIQPALFAIAVGLAARWRSFGIVPDIVVGHSMGEVAAAHVAGALNLEDATRIICRRSALLSQISGQGAMHVVAMPMAGAEQLVARYRDRVSVAVSNSPTSTVLSGDPAALAELAEVLRQRNIFSRPVRVDVASHSPQVDCLRDELLAELAGIAPVPSVVPIFSTVTGELCDGAAFGAEYWVRNLRETVLFWNAVQRLAGDGAFIEMSPHPTLLPAVEQGFELMGREGLALPSMRRDEHEAQATIEGAAALHAHGFPVRLEAVLPPGGRFVPLPRYTWSHEQFWFQASSSLKPPSVTSPAARLPDAEPLADGSASGGMPPFLSGAADDREREKAMSGFVLTAVAEVLSFDLARIDPSLGFFQMGMDSRLAVQLRVRLEDGLGRKLATPVIYEYPTVDSLARHMLTIIGPSAPAVNGGNGHGERTAAARPDQAGPGPVEGEPDLSDGLTEEELLTALADEIRGSARAAGSAS